MGHPVRNFYSIIGCRFQNLLKHNFSALVNFAGNGHYIGQMRHLASSAASYASRHGASYFTDYVQAHVDLGLALSVGRATVILSPLDAHKVRLNIRQMIWDP